MITRPQEPRRNPEHGLYVRVAVADLVEGNRYIYGESPTVGEVRTLDEPHPDAPTVYSESTRPGYRWVNGAQRERRSWRDVLVWSLTQDQRDAIVLEPAADDCTYPSCYMPARTTVQGHRLCSGHARDYRAFLKVEAT